MAGTYDHLSVFFMQPPESRCKTFFIISIHDICCCHTGTLVHTHIQCPVKTEGEATFAIIEMMGRYAEVGQDRVYLFDVVITQEVVQIAEVTAHEDEMSIVLRAVKGSRANVPLLRM